MDKIGPGVIAVLGMVFTVAIVAVIVGTNAQTGTVITAGGNALSSVIKAAVSPVSGSTSNLFGSSGA